MAVFHTHSIYILYVNSKGSLRNTRRTNFLVNCLLNCSCVDHHIKLNRTIYTSRASFNKNSFSLCFTNEVYLSPSLLHWGDFHHWESSGNILMLLRGDFPLRGQRSEVKGQNYVILLWMNYSETSKYLQKM